VVFPLLVKNTDIQIIAGAEMLIEGDIAASQNITFISGRSEHIIDISNTFDTIPGHLEFQVGPDSAVVTDLEMVLFLNP
jgi:hypothetical protein